jgi:hypothetical protein
MARVDFDQQAATSDAARTLPDGQAPVVDRLDLLVLG